MFIYWGWDSAVSVNEETKDPATTPGRAVVRVVLPLLGGLILLAAFVKTVLDDANPDNSYTVITLFGWDTGGIFILAIGSLLLGVVLMFISQWRSPAFFRGETLDRDTPIHVVEGDTLEILVPTLPDAPSTEQTVIPPMSVDELRAAAERAREQNRGES